MKTIKISIFVLLVLFTKTIFANSLTMTCDFEYNKFKGAINEVPANCTKELNEILVKLYKGKTGFMANNKLPSKLSRELYMSAKAPMCPDDYKDIDVYQGGVIAYGASDRYMGMGSNHYFYQIRRVCVYNAK